MFHPGGNKRRKELARMEKRDEKEQRKVGRKNQSTDRQKLIDAGEDPDLAGIIPGPQPIPEE